MSTMIRSAGIGAVSALALAAATSAQAITLVAGETELSIYGYAQLNASYDFDESLGSATAVSHANLDFDETGDAEDGFFDMDARQSRFGFLTTTPMGGDTLLVQIEGDFLGDEGGKFRLRHAYGSWNGILAGQYWSNFNTFIGATPTIDFNGTVGLAGSQFRNSQIRYTVGGFSVALEELSAALGSDVEGGTFKQELPALTAKYESEGGPLSWAVGAAAQPNTESDNDESETGLGAFAGASFALGTGTTLNAQLSYGDGIGVYLNNAPIAFVDAEGDLESIETLGGSVGLSQDVAAGTFNIVYGRTDVDYPDTGFADGLETQQSVFANYMWSPVEAVTYGVEVAWLDAEQVDGDSDDATRLKFMARYSF